MDAGGWEELQPWLERRLQLRVGPLLCVINGPTRGPHWSCAPQERTYVGARSTAGVRRRFAARQLRHAHAVELAREGVPLIVIQRQLGHSNLGITSVYFKASTTPRSSTPSTPVASHDPGKHIAEAVRGPLAGDAAGRKGALRRDRSLVPRSVKAPAPVAGRSVTIRA